MIIGRQLALLGESLLLLQIGNRLPNFSDEFVDNPRLAEGQCDRHSGGYWGEQCIHVPVLNSQVQVKYMKM